MSQVYINKGTNPDTPWIGACIIRDDGSIDLFGDFAIPSPSSTQLNDLRTLWNEAPQAQMELSFRAQPETVIARKATLEQVEEAESGDYGSPERNHIEAE